MNKKITRRKFIAISTAGIGALSLNSFAWPFTEIRNSGHSKYKKLIATTDYTDNIGRNYRGSRYDRPIPRSEDFYREHKAFLNKKQLDELHSVLSSLGVSRHQWIVDNYWTLYEDYPHGFNLLEEAAKSAHTYGIEFIAELKVFEGGGFGRMLPHTMPVPEGTAAKDLRGVFPIIHPFVARNMQFCLKCKPGSYEYKSPLKKVRLVKHDHKPTRIMEKNLSLYTSETNNKFEKYVGPVSFRETVESRHLFPLWRKCRVLHFENLDIPKSHKYLLIKCSFSDDKADFGNEMGNILELEGADGNIIPNYLGTGPVTLESHLNGFYNSRISSELLRYLQNPEVLAEVKDRDRMEEHYKDFYTFDKYKLTDIKTLDQDGYLVAALGKPEYLLGNLHPIYPEVREYWLDLTRFCLNAGVDGINYRIANHSKLPEKWDYGYNEEVLMASNGKTDYVTIRKINGNAYTKFLLEARDLIKSRNKKMIHHLHTNMVIPDDRGRLSSLPPNFEWQWQKWIYEIADEFEIRGGFMLRPWHLNQAIDLFSSITTEANKPLYYQGDFHGMTYNGPFNVTKEEIELVNRHRGLDGFVLYETANYTKLNDEGHITPSPEHAHIIKENFFKE